VKFKLVILLFGICLLALPTQAQQSEQANVDLKQLTRAVAGDSTSTAEKTERLVKWINTNFQWSATDYKSRTVEEIVSRRAGNCAELAGVLAALLKAADLRYRWVAEINIHPRSESRQATAAGFVTTRGKQMSVFGLRHNDHRWLEVYDEKMQSWFPADPAVGVVGTRAWVAARLGFGERPASPVPAIASITKSMITPFVVIALASRSGKLDEDRSRHYLIDEFNAFYGGKLAKLAAWAEWETLIGQLSPLATSAFAGETNLHEHANLIEQLAQVYEKLEKQARERGIVAVSQ